MKILLAHYSHSTIGFPKIELKWISEHGTWQAPYITLHGIIQPEWLWAWKFPHPEVYAKAEMDRFDDWVRSKFCDDITVQG